MIGLAQSHAEEVADNLANRHHLFFVLCHVRGQSVAQVWGREVSETGTLSCVRL